MKRIIKSILGFGVIGAIVGGVIAGFTSFPPIPNFFYYSGIGFIIGSVFALIIIKTGNITESDMAKGLEYICPNCKKGVFEIEQNCSHCGCTNGGYNQNV